MITILKSQMINNKIVKLRKWYQGRLVDYMVSIYEPNNPNPIIEIDDMTKREAELCFKDKIKQLEEELK